MKNPQFGESLGDTFHFFGAAPRNLEVKGGEVRGIDHLDSLLFRGVLQHYEDFRQ